MFKIIKKIFIKSNSLSKKTAVGTFWLFVLRVTDQVFSFVKTIILAHILSPNDFGLFGIAIISISILDSFSQTGFQEALIRKKESIESYLDTAWIIQVFRGVVLSVILFLLSPAIAYLFGVPQSVTILRVIALSIIIQGFSNVGMVYFQKEIEMEKYFIYKSIGILFDFAVSAILAFALRSVWALVWGFIVADFVKMIVSYLMQFYRPRFKFDAVKARELFDFGKWISWSSILGFFITQTDSIFVGRFLGVVNLGFYQIGYKVASITGAETISGAIFPAYSKIQHDLNKIGQAYLKSIKLLLFLLAPVAGGVFVIANEFVYLFLGQKWLAAVLPMKLLIISGLVWSLAVISVPIFSAIGKPHIETKCNSLRLFILLILIYPFIKMRGVEGAAFAVFLSVIVSAVYAAFTARLLTKCNIKNFAAAILLPLQNAFLMVISVYVISKFLERNFLNFTILIICGIILYFIFVFLSEIIFKYDIRKVIKEGLNYLNI